MERGRTTTYAGRVGHIDADHFADDMYNFGLYAYRHQAQNGQPFEVLNYWVH